MTGSADPVGELLDRMRAWRAAMPWGRSFQVLAHATSPGTTWVVSASQVVRSDGVASHTVVHHAPDLLAALERAVADVEEIDLTPVRRAPWWARQPGRTPLRRR